MHKILIPSLLLLTLVSCRKVIEAGTVIKASGTLMDPVKQKPLPNAWLYLYGAKGGFYGMYYSQGPLDSTLTDNNGNFSIQYIAKGESVDYGLALQPSIGEYINRNPGYMSDYTEPIFKFNYARNINNAIVKGRELNFLKIHLKVNSNPFDSFYVRNYIQIQSPVLLKGKSIDTTFVMRQLPRELNFIQYYTESLRDTAGLAALNSNPNAHLYSVTRMIKDTMIPGMEDTVFIEKTIDSSLSMPRQ